MTHNHHKLHYFKIYFRYANSMIRDCMALNPWPQLFERWIALSAGQRNWFLWIVIYLVDSAIQLLNNRGLDIHVTHELCQGYSVSSGYCHTGVRETTFLQLCACMIFFLMQFADIMVSITRNSYLSLYEFLVLHKNYKACIESYMLQFFDIFCRNITCIVKLHEP